MAAGSESQHHSPRTPALGLRFLFLFILSIVILIIDHREHHLDALRRTISTATYPLRVIVDAPVSAWQWLGETMTQRHELELENSRMSAERLLTNARLQRYSALEAENARLRAMLEATARVTDRVRVAEIMSVSGDPFRHSIVIDKGTTDGVFGGQAMIDAEGVVGQVIEAGPLSSQGLLISDPDHTLPVIVNRNGLRTVAFGTGEYNRLDLPFLPNNADIEEGDLLVTSGLGGAFPAGYPVALVTMVTRIPAEPFAAVSAEPAATLNQVREVMLVWSSTEADDEEEETTDDDAASPAAPEEEAEDEAAPADEPPADESVTNSGDNDE